MDNTERQLVELLKFYLPQSKQVSQNTLEISQGNKKVNLILGSQLVRSSIKIK